MKRHHRDQAIVHWLRELIRVIEEVIDSIEREAETTLTISIQGEPMANFPINAGDSVVVTFTDTDDVTGAVVIPDAGSVTATLSSTTDTLVDNADGTATLTAALSDVGSVGNTVTVNATVNGVASNPGVGTYDVIAVTPPPPDSTTLSVSFGTETPPAAPVAAATDGVNVPASEEAGTFRNS